MTSRPGDQQNNQNLYQVLGISASATTAEIKKAYHGLAIKFHPDKNSEPGATEKFRRILAAYEVLSDPVERANYDRFAFNPPQPHQSHFNNPHPQQQTGGFHWNYDSVGGIHFTYGNTVGFHFTYGIAGGFHFNRSKDNNHHPHPQQNPQNFNYANVNPGWPGGFYYPSNASCFSSKNGHYPTVFTGYWPQASTQPAGPQGNVTNGWASYLRHQMPQQRQPTASELEELQKKAAAEAAELKKRADEDRMKREKEATERLKKETEEASRQFIEKMKQDAQARLENNQADSSLIQDPRCTESIIQQLTKQVQQMRSQRLAEKWEKERLETQWELILRTETARPQRIPKNYYKCLVKIIRRGVEDVKHKKRQCSLDNRRAVIGFEREGFRQRQRDEIYLYKRIMKLEP